MGIKNYLKYLNYEYPQSKSRIYDYLYLDSNYLIHYLIYKCKSDFDLYTKLYNYFEYLFNNIKITKIIYLIFDGEYEIESELILNPKYQTHLLRNKLKSDSGDYDKQSIFPGSEILKTFKNFLNNIINKYKKINKLNFKIIVNGDDIKGEADTKILNTIYDEDQDNICILSKDSDMILIAYSLMINKKITIDILSNLRPIMFVNINKIKNYGFDYILIILLLGNDYLPKISNTSYDIILSNYKKYIKFNNPIIQNNIIDHNNLINFITYIIINSNGKKIKYNSKNIDLNRFAIYYNNIRWCLKHYKCIKENIEYICDIKFNNIINIYNFINNTY